MKVRWPVRVMYELVAALRAFRWLVSSPSLPPPPPLTYSGQRDAGVKAQDGMETIHADGTPLQAYLEGNLDGGGDGSETESKSARTGDGTFDPERDDDDHGHGYESHDPGHAADLEDDGEDRTRTFAPPPTLVRRLSRRPTLPPLNTGAHPPSKLRRLHNAWSTAVNSRLGRVDNARFLEHFRYIIIASQLLNEYLDQGLLQAGPAVIKTLDGPGDESAVRAAATSVYGALGVAATTFALVYLLRWTRNSRSGLLSKSRVALVLAGFFVVGFVAYAYIRRQWLKFLRRNAVSAASSLTASWQAFEVAGSSTLSFVQEVELVSKGYRLSAPLPPASRIEGQDLSVRRCGRLRKALHKAYETTIPACIEAYTALRTLVDEDDIEKYFEIYDINTEDVRDASGAEALSVLEDDPESLKSLRLLSYREGVLRRITLCALMAMEADGGKPDFLRWRTAVEAMQSITTHLTASTSKLRKILDEVHTLAIPNTPAKFNHPAREKLRNQVRKISMLSSGIRGLQAKMQILREETNRSIEQSDDLTDLGPSLIAQYESIGADLKDLTQAWEVGKASLQTNICKHERRISLASSGFRSPVSSIGGLTAVDEDGSPADALNLLNGLSKRSSMATTPSDSEEVFEAIAMPKQRSTLTREERLVKMQEERERQATMRANRESSTHMLKELESVINLRPKKKAVPGARITSI